MTGTVCIAGSGKIARDAGMYLFSRGRTVCWVSGDADRLALLHADLGRKIRRLARFENGAETESRASFALYDGLGNASFDAVIECGRESPGAKRDALDRLAGHCAPGAFLFSTSSSILPSSLRGGCLGLHVFFPLELTAIAELVVPQDAPVSMRERAVAFCKDLGIAPIVQGEANAFAVNRVLLPLQNEAFSALARGVSYDDADAATVSPLCGVGMCALARGVGPAVVAASVENYRSRMIPEESALYGPLSSGLSDFEASCERWKAAPKLDAGERGKMSKKLYYLFINTCLRFVERGYISRADLDVALGSAFGATTGLAQAIAREGGERIASLLGEMRRKGAPDYFEPCPALTSSAGDTRK